jgi:hypothetical protein
MFAVSRYYPPVISNSFQLPIAARDVEQSSARKIVHALEQEFGGPLILHGFPGYSKPRPAGTTFVPINEPVPLGYTRLVLMAGHQGLMVKVTSHSLYALRDDTIPLYRLEDLPNKEALPNMHEELFVLMQAVAIAHAQRQVRVGELAGAVNGQDMEGLFRKVAGALATTMPDAAEHSSEEASSDCLVLPLDMSAKRPWENTAANSFAKRLRANSDVEIVSAGKCGMPETSLTADIDLTRGLSSTAPVNAAQVSVIRIAPAIGNLQSVASASAPATPKKIEDEVFTKNLLACLTDSLNRHPKGPYAYSLAIEGLNNIHQPPPADRKNYVQITVVQERPDAHVMLTVEKFDNKGNSAEPLTQTYTMGKKVGQRRRLNRLFLFLGVIGARRMLFRSELAQLDDLKKGAKFRLEIANEFIAKNLGVTTSRQFVKEMPDHSPAVRDPRRAPMQSAGITTLRRIAPALPRVPAPAPVSGAGS